MYGFVAALGGIELPHMDIGCGVLVEVVEHEGFGHSDGIVIATDENEYDWASLFKLHLRMGD